jgi:hypothetical protein
LRDKQKEERARLRKAQELKIGYYKAREEEVEKVFIETRKRQRQGIKGQALNLKSAHFRIYSSEYIYSLPLGYYYGILYVEFYKLCELNECISNTQFEERIAGHIYFEGDNSPGLEVFESP